MQKNYSLQNLAQKSHTKETSSNSDGQFCERDTDGCSEIQCFEGVQCTDVPAPGVGAYCGSCPTGYTGNGLKCIITLQCL